MACKHGLGRFCAICNKTVRAIIQAKPPAKPREVKIPKHNIKSPAPLFIGGTPYVACGNCGVPTKKFNGAGDRFGYRDKYTKLDLERKILIGRFVDVFPAEESYTVDDKGFTVVHRRAKKLVLQSVPGCFDCWDRQEQQKQHQKHLESTVKGHKAHAVFYKK